ncbi:hypothetical protein MHW47_04215 [Streptomyces sp. OfavH-34-F]|uniref:hypothetical protein n=1 Tax=Streptomyces sp. OfavH-34-F TaxID=2917760 RepID=UPI001EF231D1|nr:hypothetical protein [Streptomyces sp. OfavH-34-F]MCG7523653.1 hypothetical protein [Streptomyces sp. OfavH-34-F]
MAGEFAPSQWADEQFGDDAAEVIRHVVKGLARGQQTAYEVQVAAQKAGAVDKRAYGSMWATRYGQVVKQFELAELPGYEARKPKGASYSLAVVNGRVLIPFRHADSLTEPISRAKLSTKIPHQVSRDNGVGSARPPLTLFEGEAEATEPAAEPSVAEAAAAASAEQLTVIYVAYAANADSDKVLAAWWGTPTSLEDDGTMVWDPEPLDMSIASAKHDSTHSRDDLRGSSRGVPRAQGFSGGDVPGLGVTHRSEVAKSPSAEQEPTISNIEDGE